MGEADVASPDFLAGVEELLEDIREPDNMSVLLQEIEARGDIVDAFPVSPQRFWILTWMILLYFIFEMQVREIF